MSRIRIHGYAGSMGASLSGIPVFPGETFGLGYPEAIGDAAKTRWFGGIAPEWQEMDDGVWKTAAKVPGELSYSILLAPSEDCVEVRFTLTNESDRKWRQSLAFNCFQCGGAPSVSDHDCIRHWVRYEGAFRRLVEAPRSFGPRPAIQLYSVEGAPAGARIPFVAGFKATPEHVALEGWIAIQSRDGKRLAATASNPALFLFQNMEYSCIHSGAGFGRLAPGETARAVNRVYFVETDIEHWHARMKADCARDAGVAVLS